jgi:hypothetical protein
MPWQARQCRSRPIAKDVRGIAKLMRLGWFCPVHCKIVTGAGSNSTIDSAQAAADQEP